MDRAWESHGTGRPVLCLHGFGLDGTVMAAALEPVLAQRPGWRRIYRTCPGHGESPAGPGDSDGVAASVHEWADRLPGGAPAVLAGWSHGGYLATAIAARWPASVARLLLVCTGVRIRPEDRELLSGPPPPAEPGWLDAAFGG